MPPLTWDGSNWLLLMKLNERMMPVTVPSSPSNGARVTQVLKIHCRRSPCSSSSAAAMAIAPSNEVWAWTKPE